MHCSGSQRSRLFRVAIEMIESIPNSPIQFRMYIHLHIEMELVGGRPIYAGELISPPCNPHTHTWRLHSKQNRSLPAQSWDFGRWTFLVRSGAPTGHPTTIQPFQPPFEFLIDLFAGHFLHLDVTFPFFLAQQRPCVKSPSLPKYAPASIERPHHAWDRLGAPVADLSTGSRVHRPNLIRRSRRRQNAPILDRVGRCNWRVCLKALGFPMFFINILIYGPCNWPLDFCSWLGPSIYFSPDAH